MDLSKARCLVFEVKGKQWPIHLAPFAVGSLLIGHDGPRCLGVVGLFAKQTIGLHFETSQRTCGENGNVGMKLQPLFDRIGKAFG